MTLDAFVEDGSMGVRNRFSTEQIIHKLREEEVELAKGKTVSEVCKHIEVTGVTYYRCRLFALLPIPGLFLQMLLLQIGGQKLAIGNPRDSAPTAGL